MTEAEALKRLTEKVGGRRDLAQRLGITPTSIYRYEHGSKVSTEILKRLSKVAKDEKVEYLEQFFSAQWQAAIVGRVEALQSPGKQRPISLSDLKRWRDAIDNASNTLETQSRVLQSFALGSEEHNAGIRSFMDAYMLQQIVKEINLYV